MKSPLRPSSWQFTALEWLACATVAIIPLWAPNGYLFPFTSMKSFLFMGLLSLMLILYAWGKWKEGTSLTITWIHGALVLFGLALAASAIFGVDPHTSWFGTFQQGTGIVYLYAFMTWAVLIGSLVSRDRVVLLQFLWVLFFAGSVSSFITFFHPAGGPFGNTSYAGPYFLLCACVGIGLMWYHRTVWKKIAAVVGLGVTLCSPVLLNPAVWQGNIIDRLIHSPLSIVGAAQGAVLGLVISLIAFAVLAATRSKKTSIQGIGVVLFILLLVGIWHGGYRLVTPGTPLNSYMVEKKTANRFVFWSIARAGFVDHPLTGEGWGNYDVIFQKYFDPVIFGPSHAIEPAMTHAHNIVWEYASTTGVLGLFAYIILFAMTFITLYRASCDRGDRMTRVSGIALGAGLIGYFIQNMFVFDTPVTYILYFSIVGVAIGMSPAKEVAFKRAGVHAVSVLMIVGSIAVFVWLCILPWREASAWTKHFYISDTGESFSPQTMSPVGGVSDTAYLAGKLYLQSTAQQLSPEQTVIFIEKLTAFSRYIAEDLVRMPDNYKAYLVKGTIENRLVALLGKADKALLIAARTDLERAIILNPRTPEPYFNLAQTAVYERSFSGAYAYIRAGIALAPEYRQGYDIADALLKVAPNKNFGGYIATMKDIWMK